MNPIYQELERQQFYARLPAIITAVVVKVVAGAGVYYGVQTFSHSHALALAALCACILLAPETKA